MSQPIPPFLRCDTRNSTAAAEPDLPGRTFSPDTLRIPRTWLVVDHVQGKWGWLTAVAALAVAKIPAASSDDAGQYKEDLSIPRDNACARYPLPLDSALPGKDGVLGSANQSVDLDGEEHFNSTSLMCETSDVLVLLDRSRSMFRWPTPKKNHYKVALRELDAIVKRAAGRNVEVIGFPSPTATKAAPCEVTSPTAYAEIASWPKLLRTAQTPLLQALTAAVEHIARKPSWSLTRIVIFTDAFHECGNDKRVLSEPQLEAELHATIARIPRTGSRIAGSPEVRFLGKIHRRDALEFQKSLDRVFGTKPCPSAKRNKGNEPPESVDGRNLVTVLPTKGRPRSVDQPEAASSASQEPDPTVAPIFRNPHAEFVDVAAIGDGVHWKCSGVLVGDLPGRSTPGRSFVLTARHCIPATQVSFGVTAGRAAQVATIEKTFLHPNRTLDVALLRLDTRIERYTHSYRVRQDKAPPAGLLRVAGFGADDASGTHGAGDLHVFDLLAGGGWGCEGNRLTQSCLPGLEMVVRGNGVHDACRGDSGGPLFEQVMCQWRLVGITSRAVPSARRACGDGGIYTRVDAIADWMHKQMEGL